MKKLFLLLILASCSSYIHTPQNRMISPETHGKFLSGSIEGRLAATKQDELSFTGNDVKKPFDGEREIYKVSGLLDLGLAKRLDFIYMDYLSGSTVGLLGLKVQVLGKTRDEAKKGNFSLSLFAGFGSNSDSFSSDNNSFNNWGSNIDKMEYDISHDDLGLILGYRWHDRLLHYANAYYFHEDVDGKVTTDDNVLNGAKFKDSQDGMIWSTGLIYELNSSWFLKADYSHMTSKWSSARGSTSNALNAGIGANW